MNACELCCDYPYWCRGICADRRKYMDEIEGETPNARSKEYKVITSDLIYEHGKRYEYNKNGIRREL